MNAPDGQINVQDEFSEKLTVHKNLGQDVIVTTVDKVRLCLLKNRDSISKKNEWLTPFSLFLSFATTLVAAEFRKFIFEAAVWQALFIFAAGACLIWILLASKAAWQNRKAGDVEGIVRELMAQQPNA